jgi:hypothetical protein
MAIFKVIVWAILALIMWLNLQPWLDVGEWIASSGIIFPFQDSILGLPVIKQVVQFLLNNVAALFAIALWAIVQTLQVMALMADNTRVREAFSRLFKGLPLSTWVIENAKDLAWLGWCAYILEGFVCLLTYPPYGDGVSDLIADFGAWDAYLLRWDQMALFAVTVLMFEGFVWLSCFFAGMVVNAGRSQNQNQQPRA